MAFTIQLQPEGKTFTCKSYETILESALEAGHVIPYGCQNGTCGKCKGDILSGEVDYGEHTDAALTDAEKANGKALFCCALPMSDLTLATRQQRLSVSAPPRILPVRVEEKQILTDDVMIMTLKLPSQEKLSFRAGQYIEFLLKDGKRRAFSIANAPHENEHIELHLRLVPNGEFTTYAFEDMPEKTIMRIEGAFGDFYLREDSDLPILMLASGTGFAPIKGMIEHMFAQNIDRDIHLYWGARSLQDLYQLELVESWVESNENFRFIPVLSQPLDEDEWKGHTGYVQDIVVSDFEDGALSGHALSKYEVYCSGLPQMVNDAHALLTKKGANADTFFVDYFDFAKPGT